MFYVVTYATHSERYFDILKQSCPEITVLGMGTKWTGFIDKIAAVRDFCRTKNPDDIVCFVDGFDSVVLDSKELEKKFVKMDKDLVVSSGSVICDNFTKYLIDKMFSTCKKDGSTLSSGMYIGKAQAVIDFWSDFTGGDDQEYATQHCDDIYVDTQNELFYNTGCDQNKLEVRNGKVYKDGVSIPVMSAPGGHSGLNPILKKLGYKDIPEFSVDMKKRLKTYGKYFLPEIMWLIVSLALLFKLPNKRIAIVAVLVLFFEVLNYEVHVKHLESNKIVPTLLDIVYLSIIFSFPFLVRIYPANMIILLVACVLFYPGVSFTKRMKYLVNKDIKYE